LINGFMLRLRFRREEAAMVIVVARAEGGLELG
jgi:hypothetical protein